MIRERHVLDHGEEVEPELSNKIPVSLQISIDPQDTDRKIVKLVFSDETFIQGSFKDNNDGAGGTGYSHPLSEWATKENLTGPIVIDNLYVNSLGHLTGWRTRNLTPQNIGAEPAFSKNSAFNLNFGIAPSTVFMGSEYGRFEVVNFPNGVENYTINHTTKYPRLYTTYYPGLKNLYAGTDMNSIVDYFYIRNTYIYDTIDLISVDGAGQWIIPKGYLPKIKIGGTVFVTQGVFRGTANTAGNGKMWHVTGDLVEVASAEIVIKRGTVVVTSSITLNAEEHDQMTLICKNTVDINITIPSGLGIDFDCNIIAEDIGNKWVQFLAGTGVTLKAPHGAKLLTDYTANISKRTNAEIFNLQGELTP